MTMLVNYPRGLPLNLRSVLTISLTLDYGDRGREAVHRLPDDAQKAGLLPKPVTVEFAA